MGLIKPSTKAYLATAGCLILIILNVGLFVFLPKSAAPLWVVISNVITVLIMLLAVKPIMTLQDKEIDEKYADFILSEIERVYGIMLKAGATSFWETEKGESDFDGAGSLCHGWSAIPVYYFNKLNG